MWKKFNTKSFFWLYFFSIILLITLPLNKPGSRYDLNDIIVVRLRGDYFFHILTFIPWVFFCPVMKKKLWIWTIGGLLFATGTELLQLALPWRTFNINDLIANGFGVLFGCLILVLFNYSRRLFPTNEI